MTITPENLQKIQEQLQKMQREVDAAITALKDDPTSPECLAKLQAAMSRIRAAQGSQLQSQSFRQMLTRPFLGNCEKRYYGKAIYAKNAARCLGYRNPANPLIVCSPEWTKAAILLQAFDAEVF
jgi:hypothetical protein